MNKDNIVKAEIIKDIHGFKGMIKITTNDEVYWIPNNTPDNKDYQEYLKWTKASPMNVTEEAE